MGPGSRSSTAASPSDIRDAIAILKSLDLSAGARDKISHRNAEALFGLVPAP